MCGRLGTTLFGSLSRKVDTCEGRGWGGGGGKEATKINKTKGGGIVSRMYRVVSMLYSEYICTPTETVGLHAVMISGFFTHAITESTFYFLLNSGEKDDHGSMVLTTNY